jgi:hypothetical protein
LSGTRKFAAILAIDVAGYLPLMSDDEAGTFQAVLDGFPAALVPARVSKFLSNVACSSILFGRSVNLISFRREN